MTARHQLDQIIARYILHNAPAIADDIAGPVDKAYAQHEIATCASGDTRRPRVVHGRHRANRRRAFGTQNPAQVSWIIRKALVLFGEQVRDIRDRCPCFGYQSQSPRFIEGHAVQARGAEAGRVIDAHALRAAPLDRKRRIRRCYRLRQIRFGLRA